MIDTMTYTEAAFKHLNDHKTYKKVTRMTAKTIENKVNTVWKSMCRKNNIPRYVEKSFISTNTDLPRFYHLIKAHKPNQGIKIRPIVANTNGPTQRITCLLGRVLKPMLEDVPAHLENSLELIECLKSGDNTTNTQFPYPFSLDVVSLYTSIPVKEAIENIINRINTSSMSLTKEGIKELYL